MLSRLLIALGLASALVAGGALAFLRTDFVANNLCSYAVATIEEATAAQVKVARCSVEPASGKLTIEGLRVGDPGGRIDLKVARVFVHVVVRPLMQRVRLERLEVDHPELHLSLDQEGGKGTPAAPGQCLPNVLDRFELGRVKVRKASVEIKAGGARIALPHASVSIKGRDDVLKIAVATRAGSVELPGRSVGLVQSRIVAVADLRGKGAIELKKADVIGADVSAFVSGKLADLCNPRIEANAHLRVDDLEATTGRLVPGVLHGVKGGLSVDATLSLDKGVARAKGDVRVKALALEGFLPGDVSLRFDLTPERVKVDRLELPFGRGAVGGSAELEFSGALPLSADLSLREMELGDLLRKLGFPHSPLVLRASGKVVVRGELSPLRLGGDVAVDFADFAVLDKPWEQRSRAQKLFELPRGRLSSVVAIDAANVVLRKTAVDTGSAKVEVEATFSTDLKQGMQLLAHAEGLDLADFKRHIGPLPASGIATVAARIGGPYAAIAVEGSAAIHDARFLELALGDVSTQATFSVDTMLLVLDQIRGRKDRSTYSGRIAVNLEHPSTPLEAHLELQDAWVHDLVELLVGMVPALAPLRSAEDVEGRVAGVLDVLGPVGGPDGTASVTFSDLRLWGQGFEKGSGSFTLHGDEPRLQVESLELQHGSEAVLSLNGRFGPRWQLEMDARTRNFTLADLDPAKPARLSGGFAAASHLGGTADKPLIETTMKFFDGRAGKAVLGDGDLTLRIDDKQMTWGGKIGTHALKGEATLSGSFPFACKASLRIPDLNQYLDVFVPEAAIQSGSVEAEIELQGSLLDWRASAGAVTLSQLKVVKSDMQFENDGPARFSFGPQGLQIKQLALRAPYTSVKLLGGRGADGRLDLRLNASVDGRIAQALIEDIEHASGTWQVQAAVGGTTQKPTILGNLRIEGGEVRLRGLPVAARELNGSISFSQDALVIDSMVGKLNNGEARVSGGMEMTQLHPRRIDMSAHIADVNVRLQETLGATLDGDLTLFGPPLEPTLGGSLIVGRMTYTEDLDLEKSLLDFSRRPPTPKVLTKSPVVVHFDLDVHLSRGVRIENNLARTDLKGDLKLTGTSRAVGLLGSVNTVHGTASFRGNEFQIEQGVLTFTDRQRIRPSFDLQALSTVKDYKIRLHAFGSPGDTRVNLSSEPALAEADIGFLLTFGFISQNLQYATAGAAADSGLAIGVEALNKMTGFSEEVRRFIPKNLILRDPSIDFASDFSVTTNRLEPMARFHSHLINDRMDLRVLEGLTTRRYRGVVSYQLSDALSTRFQLDNEHLGTATDFGIDLHLKWEGE